jgi:ABC-type multidrug transport system fused ATPase/permease subunit
LRAHLRPARKTRWTLLATLCVGTILPLVGPALIGMFVDDALDGAPLTQLIAIAFVYLVTAIGGQGVAVMTTWMASHEAWSATNRLREELAEHALGLDLAYFGDHPPGELIERVDGDVHALAEFYVTFLVEILGSALLLAGTLVIVTFVDYRLGMALAIFVAVSALVLVRAQHRAVPTGMLARQADAHLFGDIEEHLVAAEDLRANGAGAHIVRRVHEAHADVYRADVRAEIYGGGLIRLTSLAFTLGTVLVLGLGITLQRQGVITVGTTVLLFQYTQLVRRPLERIIDQLKQLQQAQAGAARAAELLEERPTLVAPPPDRIRPLPAGALTVELRDVTFAYEGDDTVLHGVNLSIPAGHHLGLVGRSGAGKTTITRLVVRLHDPGAGEVRLGGVDLHHVDPAELRHRTAVVTQDVLLFPASVRDNFTLFRPELASDDDLLGLTHDLGLDEWLAGLPAGLDTELGGEVGLSAGEAQLVALGRAFLADPGLVVLDEPSSRLDPATEAAVETAVTRLLEGRTAIVIAHRLDSLEHVDEIAVIEAGRIVELGPRAELAADPESQYAILAAAGRAGGAR